MKKQNKNSTKGATLYFYRRNKEGKTEVRRVSVAPIVLPSTGKNGRTVKAGSQEWLEMLARINGENCYRIELRRFGRIVMSVGVEPTSNEPKLTSAIVSTVAHQEHG